MTDTGKDQALLERRARHIAPVRSVVLSVVFLSFHTAAVTSSLIERNRRRSELSRDAAAPADLSEVVAGIARLEERLERLETRLAADE